MPVITFDPTAFKAAFPEFANCSDGQCSGWFSRATLLFANDTCNPAFADGNMAALYNLLVAHIGWLNAPRDSSGQPAQTGQLAPPTVGRINSAGEGSVNASFDMGDANVGSPSQAWYMQTRYGAEYWSATSQYRTARYGRAPIHNFQPVYPWWPGRW